MDKQAAERGSPRILLGKIAEDLPDSIPEAGKFFDVLREKLTDIFQPPISAILKTSSDKFDYSKWRRILYISVHWQIFGYKHGV